MPSPCYLSVSLCHDSYRGFIIDSDDSCYYGYTEFRKKIAKYDPHSGKTIFVDDMLVRPARWTLEGECINPYDTKKDIDPVLNENEIWPILSYQSPDVHRMVGAFIRYAECLANPSENIQDLTYLHKRLRQDYGSIMLVRHILEGDVKLGMTRHLDKKHVLMAKA